MSEDGLRQHYSRAIDEIYALRTLLAYEASTLVETLDYKSFPRGRRLVTEKQVQRMMSAARGHGQREYRESDDVRRHGKRSLHEAGAETELTTPQWEAEQAR